MNHLSWFIGWNLGWANEKEDRWLQVLNNPLLAQFDEVEEGPTEPDMSVLDRHILPAPRFPIEIFGSFDSGWNNRQSSKTARLITSAPLSEDKSTTLWRR